VGRYDGKVVLVTGAASGLGRAVAVRVASEGARVLGVDVSAGGLAETAELVAKASVETVGGAHEMGQHVGDVSAPATGREAVATAVSAFGKLDVLVNCAGLIRAARLDDVTEADWDLQLDVNLKGTFFMCQAAIPHLIETHGNVVNVASNAGNMGVAYAAAYNASKFGVIGITKSLAMEFIKEPIRINAVAPGGMATPLTSGYAMPRDPDFELMARYTGFRPMAEPEEVAAVIAMLGSDDASNVHGAIWNADCGITAG
jgi:meso-butanediol dehydrogenase / (S,S)-butanediol dehydrogenase / diacetyl reductase